MKTPNPLAAALLLMAASASAQFGPAVGTSYFGGANTNPLSLGAASGPVDDIVFKCGTVPYIACTAEHMNKRENIRITGTCPAPASAACTEYLMSTRGAVNPAETIAAYDPPPGRQWASPDCQRIPCRLADEPSAPSTSRPRNPTAYDQEPGFIGPPAPPSGPAMPPPFSPADFQRELADARAENGGNNTIVDLGDNRYGVILDNGTVAVCGLGQCTERPASEIPNLAEKIQVANSINNGDSINKENPNGFTPTSVPTPPGGRSRQGTTTPPEDVASTPSDEARGSGNDAGNLSMSGGGASGRGASAGGTSGGGAPGSYAATAANGKVEALKTTADDLDDIRMTYHKNILVQESIIKAETAVKNEVSPFAMGNTPDANAGNLKFKGTQSEANR